MYSEQHLLSDRKRELMERKSGFKLDNADLVFDLRNGRNDDIADGTSSHFVEPNADTSRQFWLASLISKKEMAVRRHQASK